MILDAHCVVDCYSMVAELVFLKQIYGILIIFDVHFVAEYKRMMDILIFRVDECFTEILLGLGEDEKIKA